MTQSRSYRAIGFYIDKFELENDLSADDDKKSTRQTKRLPIRTFKDTWLRRIIKISLSNPSSVLQLRPDQQKSFDLTRLAQGAAELTTLPEKPSFILLPLFYLGKDELRFECKLFHILNRELSHLKAVLVSDLEPVEVNLALLHRAICVLVHGKKLNLLHRFCQIVIDEMLCVLSREHGDCIVACQDEKDLAHQLAWILSALFKQQVAKTCMAYREEHIVQLQACFNSIMYQIQIN